VLQQAEDDRRLARGPTTEKGIDDMHHDTAFVLTFLVLCYAVVSGLVKRSYLAPALIFVALGMILGSSGLELVELARRHRGIHDPRAAGADGDPVQPGLQG
jgi:hypothetical protein